MRKQILAAACMLFSAANFAQIVPNAGFENWSGEFLYELPEAGGVELVSSNQETYFRYDEVTVTPGQGGNTALLQNYAVMNEGDTDTTSAYLVWGEPGDDMPFPGGFMIDEIPSTFDVSVRYKSNITSPSFFLVQYVKADTTLAFEIYPLTGESTAGGFDTLSWDLPDVAVVPDLVVVGFGLNNLVDDGEKFLDDYLEVDYLRFDDAPGSIPGGELNDWGPVTLSETPDDWWAPNSPSDTVVIKDMDASEGMYSMHLLTKESIDYDNWQVQDTVAGVAFLAEYDYDTDELIPTVGISTTGTYVFSFDYKYAAGFHPSIADSGIVIVATGNSDPVNGFEPNNYEEFRLGNSSIWWSETSQEFQVEAGDSLIIAASSSASSFDDGDGPKIPMSSLWLDNISFDLITGLNPNNANEAFTVYPNPSTGVFKYNFSGVEEIKSVKVVDITGNVIYQSSTFGTFDTEINLTDQPDGVYNLVIESAYGTTSRKMIKQ